MMDLRKSYLERDNSIRKGDMLTVGLMIEGQEDRWSGTNSLSLA